MSDSILNRYSSQRAEANVANGAAPPDTEAFDNLGAFGFLRGAKERATMVELRRKDGTIRAIPYGWLEGADFDPSDGITLRVGGQSIRIKGRNLNIECRPEVRLFSAICRHRVPWIQETDEPGSMEANDKSTIVDLIQW